MDTQSTCQPCFSQGMSRKPLFLTHIYAFAGFGLFCRAITRAQYSTAISPSILCLDAILRPFKLRKVGGTRAERSVLKIVQFKGINVESDVMELVFPWGAQDLQEATACRILSFSCKGSNSQFQGLRRSFSCSRHTDCRGAR